MLQTYLPTWNYQSRHSSNCVDYN